MVNTRKLEILARCGSRKLRHRDAFTESILALRIAPSRLVRLRLAARVHVRNAIYAGGVSLADGIAAELETLGISDLPTDLFLDLDYLAPEVDLNADDLGSLIRSCMNARSWRTITVTATTVPGSYADLVDEGELRAINRREWGLYERLIASGFPDVRFGDYGIQNCTPPDPMKVDKMVANIRFVVGGSIWVARGKGALRPMTLDEKAEQYSELASRLMGVDGFIGRGCCAAQRGSVPQSGRSEAGPMGTRSRGESNSKGPTPTLRYSRRV